MSLFFPQVVYCKENIFFKLLGRLQTRDINSRSPNRFTWRWQFLFLVTKKEQEIFRSRIWACIFRVKWCTVGCIMQWHEVASKPNSSGDVSWEKEIAPLLLWICWLEKSGLIFFYFYICYHAGGSTKHLPRPEVKRREEESSPKDALTPKEGKTRFAGKMRTYLWACPVTPTPQPHLPFPCLCKINMCRSSKMTWIDVIRTTRYPLILMLCCDDFMFVVKQGVLSDEDLERLSQKFEKWKTVGRYLEIVAARLTAFDNENREWSGKIFKRLLH